MPASTRPQRPERWLARGLADRLDRQPLHLGAHASSGEIRATPVSTTYRMPGTVSEVSATLVASTTRRPVCGGEDPVLLGGREPGVERHDLERRPRSSCQVGERVGGVADLALAGQEDQDVARSLAGQLADRVDDRLGLVADDRLALLVVLGQLDERAVADLDRVGAAGDLDDRRRRAAPVGEVLRRTARGSMVAEVMISLRSGRRGSSRLR